MPRTIRLKPQKKIIKKVNKRCLFTEQKIEYIDYKDAEQLKKFTSLTTGKILPKRITGATAKNQRDLAKAIKRSREMGLLKYIAEK